MDTIIFQQIAMFRTPARALFVRIANMKDKWFCSVAILTWMNMWRKKLEIPYTPDVKRITQPVYNNCEDSLIFEWIMQSPVPILVRDALSVRKGVGSSSADSDDGFEVQFDGCSTTDCFLSPGYTKEENV
jgi:hypothetical protein